MRRFDFLRTVGTSLVAPGLQSYGARLAPQFAFRSNSWVNLHHRLYQTADWAEARRRGYRIVAPGNALLETPARLPPSARHAWNAAVEAYRTAFIVTRKDLLFDSGLEAVNVALSDAAGNRLPHGLPVTVADALANTAHAYRRYLWPADHRANIAWIASLRPGIARFGDAMQRRLSGIYDTPWPAKPFRIDVARYAYRFGAYTNVEAAYVHTVMESGDPRLHGLSAVEMLYHEASHSVVAPDEGTIGGAVLAAARRAGHPEPDQFWHAVIFYSAGSVAEEVFRAHGRTYRMYADVNGLFGPRVWPRYREPLRTHWQAYLDRGGDLRVAIDRCVRDLVS